MKFWFGRLGGAIRSQLTQGVTPDRIALTVALGATLSIFPVWGATTLLCAVVGGVFRLNQPMIQLVNYAVSPLQLLLLIPFYQAGGRVLGRAPGSLSLSHLLEQVRADFWLFMSEFGIIALGGVIVWSMVAPVTIAGLYYGSRHPLRGLAARLRRP